MVLHFPYAQITDKGKIKNKKREVNSQSYRINLWEHSVLTALCPDSVIAATALTKHISGILKVSFAYKSFYVYHFLCRGHSLSL